MIKLKSLKAPVEKESDGYRILITRHGIPYKKNNELLKQFAVDKWFKELAASKELDTEYNTKEKRITWEDYRSRFIKEIHDSPRAADRLEEIASLNYAGVNITLLCHCKDPRYCHRSLVKELAERYIEKKKNTFEPIRCLYCNTPIKVGTDPSREPELFCPKCFGWGQHHALSGHDRR